MAESLARGPLTVNGQQFKAGQPVPLDRLRPDLRKKLIDQRRVLPHTIAVNPGNRNER